MQEKVDFKQVSSATLASKNRKYQMLNSILNILLEYISIAFTDIRKKFYTRTIIRVSQLAKIPTFFLVGGGH